MKRASMIAAVGFSLTLAACGGKGDDKLGEQVQEAAENKVSSVVQFSAKVGFENSLVGGPFISFCRG